MKKTNESIWSSVDATGSVCLKHYQNNYLLTSEFDNGLTSAFPISKDSLIELAGFITSDPTLSKVKPYTRKSKKPPAGITLATTDGKIKTINIGHFFDKDDVSTFIYPVAHANKKKWRGQASFIANLRAAQNKASLKHYKGISCCRICEAKNGSSGYTYYTGDKFMVSWPSGWMHYITEHNVFPIDAEIALIAAIAKDDKQEVIKQCNQLNNYYQILYAASAKLDNRSKKLADKPAKVEKVKQDPYLKGIANRNK